MIQLNYAFSLFLSLIVTSLPYLLAGIVVSSCLLVFVDEHQLVAKLPRNRFLGAIVGSGLGLLIPVCQYGNVPVARRLLMQGVPIPLAISFLIAAPTINPIVIWLTWKTFPERPSIVLWRVLLTWVISITVALIFSTYRDKQRINTPEPREKRSSLLKFGTFLLPSDESNPQHRVGNLIYQYPMATAIHCSLPEKLLLLAENIVRELIELASILTIGCAIAAILQAFLPSSQLLTWGQIPVAQLLVMMLLGLILSLGSTANVFFASSLSATFLNGSLLAFLLLGSMIDLKTIGLLLSTVRPRAVLYLLLLLGQLTFLSTLLLNFYLS